MPSPRLHTSIESQLFPGTCHACSLSQSFEYEGQHATMTITVKLFLCKHICRGNTIMVETAYWPLLIPFRPLMWPGVCFHLFSQHKKDFDLLLHISQSFVLTHKVKLLTVAPTWILLTRKLTCMALMTFILPKPKSIPQCLPPSTVIRPNKELVKSLIIEFD